MLIKNIRLLDREGLFDIRIVDGKFAEMAEGLEVVNNEERGIYTYLEYMTIMILTLGVEVIVLFRKKEEVNEEK